MSDTKSDFSVPPCLDQIVSNINNFAINPPKKEAISSSNMPVTDKNKELKITDEDKNNFLMAVLEDRPYKEKFSLLNGKLSLELRTRTLSETQQIIGHASLRQNISNAEFEIILGKAHLAYALTTVNNDNKILQNDTGTLQERLDKIDKLSSAKYMLLISCMNKFDEKVANLTKIATQSAF